MKLLTGYHERSIDKKNRLQIPANFRQRFDPKEDGAGFYLTVSPAPRVLTLFAETLFESLATRVAANIDRMEGEQARKAELRFFALPVPVELDAEGRILIPEHLKNHAKLGTDVVLVGVRDRIDIYRKEDFDGQLGLGADEEVSSQLETVMRVHPGV